MAFLSEIFTRAVYVSRRAVLPLLAGSLVLGIARTQSAQAQQISEYEVKAAFLLNFTKFVEWKPDVFSNANSPLTICIMGSDPFGTTIDLVVENELVNNRKLTVRRISDVPQAKTCQVLYISSTGRELRRILRQVGAGVLTVGDADDFIEAGGIVRFIVENRRVRFEIARGVAENMGLQVSSQLLKVARLVR
jgi:hypothetical protein